MARKSQETKKEIQRLASKTAEDKKRTERLAKRASRTRTHGAEVPQGEGTQTQSNSGGSDTDGSEHTEAEAVPSVPRRVGRPSGTKSRLPKADKYTRTMYDLLGPRNETSKKLHGDPMADDTINMDVVEPASLAVTLGSNSMGGSQQTTTASQVAVGTSSHPSSPDGRAGV